MDREFAINLIITDLEVQIFMAVLIFCLLFSVFIFIYFYVFNFFSRLKQLYWWFSAFVMDMVSVSNYFLQQKCKRARAIF